MVVALAGKSAIRRMFRMAAFVLLVLLILHTYRLASRPWHSSPTNYQQRMYDPPETVPDGVNITIIDLARQLYQPFVPSIVQDKFITPSGKEVKLTGKPRFTKPLGKKVCIVDVESRPLEGAGGLLNKEALGWANVKWQTAGFLNHYLYSQIHGYDYRFVKAKMLEDRHPTWCKVEAVAEIAKEYDVVVFMDADASWPNLELPLEWLMNYWKVSPEKAITLAKDPDLRENWDEHKNIMLNTGFMIIQNTSKTEEIFGHWAECPDESKYRGCSKYKYQWPHEQAVFSNYLRYDYADYILELPCYEANGCPEAKEFNCMGTLARHCWARKGKVTSQLANMIMQPFGERLHQELIGNMDEYYREGPGVSSGKWWKKMSRKGRKKTTKEDEDSADSAEDDESRDT